MREDSDLHGAAPDQCKVALLIIDMINDFQFDNGEKLQVKSLTVAKNIYALKQKAKTLNIPVIYVNDNFGKWKSDFNVLVNHCINDNTPGKPIAELLKPEEGDYFVLKPKHSAFYSTTLDLLLKYLTTETLILTGITSDICILFTANDAYMRDFKIITPFNCTAAISEEDHRTALKTIERIHRGITSDYSQLDLKKFL